MESDYTLLYLHHGLTSDNKPSFSWLRDAYREFDRKWVGASGGPASRPYNGLPSAQAGVCTPCLGEVGAPETWVTEH